MLSRSVIKFVASDGIPMAILIDEDRIPLFYPNIYATTLFRSLGSSVSTIDKVLRCIGIAHFWGIINNIDLEKTFLSSKTLTNIQFQDLAFFLRLSKEEQNKLYEHRFNIACLNEKNISKQISQLIYISKKVSNIKKTISSEEGAFRIRTVANYLNYLFQRSTKTSQTNQYVEAKRQIDYFLTLAPKVSNKVDQDTLQGLSIDERQIVLELINPTNPDNPFRSTFLKYRNQLIYELLLSTGIRRSELRFLKVADIEYSNNLVHIRVSKTKARTVHCSTHISELFHNFVTNHLSKIPYKQRKHSYLFTTETGEHLSNDAINLMFRTLRKNANLTTTLTPHTLRRTWNDVFSELIDQLPEDKKPNHELEKQMRNRLMGWSSISDMSSRYAHRYIQKKADEIAESLSHKLTSTSV